MKLKIVKSHLANKKLDAIFTYDDGKTKTIPFGAANFSDYTIHHDKNCCTRYITRHSKHEEFNEPMTTESLSRWILWGDSTSLETNIRSFKQRFNLK